ncbi:MAG: acetyl-CoA carboxylase biotin carboxyl carrier protein [Chlamydiota bacterium]
MDLSEIKSLVEWAHKHRLSKFSLKKGDFELHVECGGVAPTPLPSSHEGDVDIAKKIVEKPAAKENNYLKSPMVGTFYSSPSPDQPPFVRVGDAVEEDTIVGIVEAMKVMNEVKAGRKGVVKEVLMENAQPVEFGTKLLRIG